KVEVRQSLVLEAVALEPVGHALAADVLLQVDADVVAFAPADGLLVAHPSPPSPRGLVSWLCGDPEGAPSPADLSLTRERGRKGVRAAPACIIEGWCPTVGRTWRLTSMWRELPGVIVFVIF